MRGSIVFLERSLSAIGSGSVGFAESFVRDDASIFHFIPPSLHIA
jgi:hypothetical protein